MSGGRVAEGADPVTLPKQTALIDKRDRLDRRLSEFHQVVLSEQPMSFPWKQSDTHGDYKSHM